MILGETCFAQDNVQTLKGDVVKIKVHDINGHPDWYLACKCNTITTNTLPCGRFTRGFIATSAQSTSPSPRVQCNTSHESRQHTFKKGLTWLKDSWRQSSSESEASIYYELKDKGVQNLPDILCAGDVLVGSTIQETVNDTLLSDSSTESWRRSTDTIHHMIHHRIVSGLLILIPLDYAENAKELLLVGRDVLHALAGAFHKGSMYHRDLSKGNLMMTERRGDDEGPWGVLNDWDRATRTDADLAGRTGTWQFISCSLLRNAAKLHDIFDDLESLLWVLLFFAIHNFKYTGDFDKQLFDEVCDVMGENHGRIVQGGYRKLWWLDEPVIVFDCKPLQDFFDSYRNFHQDHLWKIALSRKDQEEKQALEDYEAEIQKDVYSLVSHFNNVLNNPDTDWSGQEAHDYRSTEAPPPVQQGQDDRRDDEMGDPGDEEEARPAAQVAERKRWPEAETRPSRR
ncbi:hypothetical protein QCA50_008745 [Cerrena zonata]|uniref:Fungal-type protein kinase domain-containing protein n=1 Tax=Cerrena zonata TaxID=2478898 RepID=A0AAW0G7G1_9APHY